MLLQVYLWDDKLGCGNINVHYNVISSCWELAESFTAMVESEESREQTMNQQNAQQPINHNMLLIKAL